MGHLSVGGSLLDPEWGGIQQEWASRRGPWAPPSLDPDLEYFFGEHTLLQGAEERRCPQQDLWPKPPLKDHCKWIEWHAQCMDMPAWWWELQAIPDVEDHQELAWKVRASFKVPMAWSQAWGGENDCSALPAPKCIGKDRFLPPQTHKWVARTITWARKQDFGLCQSTPVLEGEGEAINPWLAPAIGRKCSGAKTGHGAVYDLWRNCDVCCNHQACLKGSFLVVYSGRQPGLSVGHIDCPGLHAGHSLGETLLQQAVPTNQPSTCLSGLEDKARELPQVATLPTLPGEAEEGVKPEEAEEVVKPKEVVKVEETEDVAALVTLVWTQVHPSRPVVPVGLVPHSLDDEWHHCHNHSHCSHRRASLQAEKSQQSSSTSDYPWCNPRFPCDNSNLSPLAPLGPSIEISKETTIAWPLVPPPGFVDIANTLWRSQSPQTLPKLIEEAPTPVVGSTLFVSHMVQDAWANLCVSMVTCQLSVMGVGSTPTVTVSAMSPQGHPQIWLGRYPPPRFFLVCTPTLSCPQQLSAPSFV